MILKVAHTENTQRPSELSAADRDYDLEQPTFEEVNKKFNTDMAKEIFLNISPKTVTNKKSNRDMTKEIFLNLSPKSETDAYIETKPEIENSEPATEVELHPQEISQSVQAALIALMKRETSVNEMCNLLKELANEGKLEELVKELDQSRLEKLWSFESKMLIGRTEIDARNERLTKIFSLLSEAQVKTSLNISNFLTIIGDSINGSSKAAANGFSPEMLETIASESTSVEKVHSLGNVIASFEVHDTPKLKRNLQAVSNVHALGVVD